VLVPHTGAIVTECDMALQELERRGYVVRRVPGYSAMDVARNELAFKALKDGFQETMWIDSDIGFEPDSIDRLRSHNLPMVVGLYPKKGRRDLACTTLPETKLIVFGKNGGLIEVRLAAKQRESAEHEYSIVMKGNKEITYISTVPFVPVMSLGAG